MAARGSEEDGRGKRSGEGAGRVEGWEARLSRERAVCGRAPRATKGAVEGLMMGAVNAPGQGQSPVAEGLAGCSKLEAMRTLNHRLSMRWSR